MSNESVLSTLQDGVRVIELNRPDDRNRIYGDLHEAIAEQILGLVDEKEARAVLITARGPDFCAGADVQFVTKTVADPHAGPRAVRRDREMMNALRTCPMPTIAAINGCARGLGMSIALHCDFVFMAQDAWMNDSHIAIGLPCGDGGAAMLPALIPMMRAKQFLFTGDPITAPVAVELGLALEAVPDDELRDRSLAFARRIADQPPGALQATKLAVNAHLGWVPAAADLGTFAEGAGLQSAEFIALFERATSELMGE